MRSSVITVVLLLAAACASPFASGEQRYTGVYAEGMETMTFHPDGRDEAWAATGPAIYALQAAAGPRNDQRDGFRVRATIVGRLSARGRYGHLGMFPREIEITEVIEAARESASSQYGNGRRTAFDKLRLTQK